MNEQQHYQALERMYLSAPINGIFLPRIVVSNGQAKIEIDIQERFFHAAGAVHGAVYFKMLDDAAFFAANSIETGFFVLTTAFTTYLTKPVSAGRLESFGKVVNQNKTQIIAEAVVYNAEQVEIGRGSGIFVRSKVPLSSVAAYESSV